MKWLKIELIRAHLRVDCDCENELLEMYAESAEEQVLTDIGHTYEEIVAAHCKVPMPLIHASLMLVDFAYQQRTMVSNLNWSVVPYTYERLVKPYARLAYPEYSEETTATAAPTTITTTTT